MPASAPTAPAILASVETLSPAETGALAARLAGAARPGDILLLSGDLGAGKTAFARAFIQTLLAKDGRMEDVPSPTYTLVQTYVTEAAEIWHADLYRLGDPSELVELGLLDAGPEALLLVEWPELAGEAWPGHAYWLQFEATGPEARKLSLSRVDGRTAPAALVQGFAPR